MRAHGPAQSFSPTRRATPRASLSPINMTNIATVRRTLHTIVRSITFRHQNSLSHRITERPANTLLLMYDCLAQALFCAPIISFRQQLGLATGHLKNCRRLEMLENEQRKQKQKTEHQDTQNTCPSIHFRLEIVRSRLITARLFRMLCFWYENSRTFLSPPLTLSLCISAHSQAHRLCAGSVARTVSVLQVSTSFSTAQNAAFSLKVYSHR